MKETMKITENNNKSKTKEAPKFKLVHVNMTENTLHKIDAIQSRVHAENKTTAIRNSIDIADMVTDVISRGGKVIFEENGNKYIMKLPGIG